MKQKNRRFALKTADLVLIGGLLAVAAVLFLVLSQRSTDGRTVKVEVDGGTVVALPLAVDTTYVIEGANGERNTLVISGGKATVTEATCPDGVCVRHRAIDKAGQSILCLPNKVVVRVDGEPLVDAEA